MGSVILLAQVVEQVKECLNVAESRLGCIEVTTLTNAISHPVRYLVCIRRRCIGLGILVETVANRSRRESDALAQEAIYLLNESRM